MEKDSRQDRDVPCSPEFCIFFFRNLFVEKKNGEQRTWKRQNEKCCENWEYHRWPLCGRRMHTRLSIQHHFLLETTVWDQTCPTRHDCPAASSTSKVSPVAVQPASGCIYSKWRDFRRKMVFDLFPAVSSRSEHPRVRLWDALNRVFFTRKINAIDSNRFITEIFIIFSLCSREPGTDHHTSLHFEWLECWHPIVRWLQLLQCHSGDVHESSRQLSTRQDTWLDAFPLRAFISYRIHISPFAIHSFGGYSSLTAPSLRQPFWSSDQKCPSAIFSAADEWMVSGQLATAENNKQKSDERTERGETRLSTTYSSRSFLYLISCTQWIVWTKMFKHIARPIHPRPTIWYRKREKKGTSVAIRRWHSTFVVLETEATCAQMTTLLKWR